MKQFLPYLFVVIAFLSWGAYVPTIHHGQLGFDKGPLRAFLFVGLAYFLVAVLVPGQSWAGRACGSRSRAFQCHARWRLWGARRLSVIFALRTGGRPIYVAPLVFAGA
jgi:hypothetical protein